MDAEELGNSIAEKYGPGTFGKKQFRKTFGLKPVDEGQAFSEGSTTGTKQTGALGTYLTEADFNRERNSDKTWEAYASVYGQEAMQSKREGNEEGLSINAFDALMDRLSGEAEEKEETVDRSKTQLSPQLAASMAGQDTSQAFDRDPMNYVKLMRGGDDFDEVTGKYKDDYKLNLKKRMKPGGGRGGGIGEGPMPR